MTLQDVLRRRGIPFRTSTGDAAKVHVCCPFCASRGKSVDSQFKLCIHAVQGWGRCVHCDWRRPRALSDFLKTIGVNEVPSGMEVEVVEKAPPRLPEDFRLLSKDGDDLEKIAFDYLIGRGVSERQMKKYRIGTSFVGKYAYRILFPAYDGKTLLGINARDFTGRKKLKYLNSKGDKGIFAFDPEARVSLFCEGAIKALRCRRAVPDVAAGALLGNALTDVQLAQLKKSRCEEVILYPDPDSPGRKGMSGIAEKLREHWGGTVKIAWPVSVPADEASWKVLRETIAGARLYSWEMIQRLKLG